VPVGNGVVQRRHAGCVALVDGGALPEERGDFVGVSVAGSFAQGDCALAGRAVGRGAGSATALTLSLYVRSGGWRRGLRMFACLAGSFLL
jgi:hypothetical protein